jgi:hypothetical protein
MAKVEKISLYVLTLTQEEKNWLQFVLQNPIMDNETAKEEKMRTSFFETLKLYQ